MPLILKVKSYRNASPEAPIFCEIPEQGGTIGRGKDATLVLPDPKQYISRSHASVFRRGERWYYLDGGSNPSLVNGRPLTGSREALLSDGDLILVGEYLLQVSLEESSGAAFSGASATAPWALDTLSGVDVTGGPHRAASDAGVGARRLDPPVAPNAYSGSVPDHVQPIHQPWQGSPGVGAPMIPEGENFLDPISAPAPVAQPRPMQAKPLPIAAPPAGAPAQPPMEVAAALHAAPAPSKAPRALQPPPVSVPPAASATMAQVQMPAPRARGGGAGESVSEGVPTEQIDFLRALLEGLGMTGRVKVPTDHALALARMAGEALHETVVGTMAVLRARTIAKSEFDVQNTMMNPDGNNPLKFFPDAEMVFEQTLIKPRRGFKQLPDALSEAFEDIRAHEMAVMAGMEAAVRGILARLDPALLGRQVPEPGGFSGMLPGKRMSRQWEAFQAAHAELSRASSDEFQQVISESFSKAYEAQVARLRSNSSR